MLKSFLLYCYKFLIFCTFFTKTNTRNMQIYGQVKLRFLKVLKNEISDFNGLGFFIARYFFF